MRGKVLNERVLEEKEKESRVTRMHVHISGLRLAGMVVMFVWAYGSHWPVTPTALRLLLPYGTHCPTAPAGLRLPPAYGSYWPTAPPAGLQLLLACDPQWPMALTGHWHAACSSHWPVACGTHWPTACCLR